jgi:hypothetical protein
MSAKVYAALTDDFIRRMRNWAQTNAGVGIYAMSAAYSLARIRGGETPMPVLIGESEDTSRALDAIPARYRQAVMWFWQFEGRPLCWFARRSGEGVDYRTYEARVLKGHELLKAELYRAREAAEQVRKQYRTA